MGTESDEIKKLKEINQHLVRDFNKQTQKLDEIKKLPIDEIIKSVEETEKDFNNGDGISQCEFSTITNFLNNLKKALEK